MSGPLLGLPAAVADVQDKLGRVQTAGGWAWAVFDGCGLSDGKVKLSSATTQGTVTLDIFPTSLYAWRNLYFKTKKPANTDITCAVKDTSDNVLIPNIADGGDLSSIDPTQYKTLRLVWTLTRNSVEDESPVVYEPFWSWLGGNDVFDLSGKTPIASKIEMTAAGAYQTVIEVTGSGVAVIGLYNNSTTSQSVQVKITVDGTILQDDTISVRNNFSAVYGMAWLKSVDNEYVDKNWGFTLNASLPAHAMPISPTIGFKNSFKFEVAPILENSKISAVAVVLA